MAAGRVDLWGDLPDQVPYHPIVRGVHDWHREHRTFEELTLRFRGTFHLQVLLGGQHPHDTTSLPDPACYALLDMRPTDTSRRMEFAAQTLIGMLAAVLLFWGLADKYLWQDEAATAVLAQRMLKFGRPMAYDGVNLITTDAMDDDDVESVQERTGDPRAAIAYCRECHEFKADTTLAGLR